MSNLKSHSGKDLVSIVILFNQYYEKRIINLYCLCLASRVEARRLRRLNNNNNNNEEVNRDDNINNNDEEEVNRDDNPTLYPTLNNILNN